MPAGFPKTPHADVGMRRCCAPAARPPGPSTSPAWPSATSAASSREPRAAVGRGARAGDAEVLVDRPRPDSARRTRARSRARPSAYWRRASTRRCAQAAPGRTGAGTRMPDGECLTAQMRGGQLSLARSPPQLPCSTFGQFRQLQQAERQLARLRRVHVPPQRRALQRLAPLVRGRIRQQPDRHQLHRQTTGVPLRHPPIHARPGLPAVPPRRRPGDPEHQLTSLGAAPQGPRAARRHPSRAASDPRRS